MDAVLENCSAPWIAQAVTSQAAASTGAVHRARRVANDLTVESITYFSPVKQVSAKNKALAIAGNVATCQARRSQTMC